MDLGKVTWNNSHKGRHTASNINLILIIIIYPLIPIFITSVLSQRHGIHTRVLSLLPGQLEISEQQPLPPIFAPSSSFILHPATDRPI